MRIKLFDFEINDGYLRQVLIENDFVPSFDIKKKFYYNFFRPFIPMRLRKALQYRINANLNYNDNFIDTTLLDYIHTKDSFAEYLNSFKYPSNTDFTIVLTHDVEEQDGFNFIPKVIELEEKYGFKSSWNIVPFKYKIDNNIIKFIQENGHEIGIHGFNHDGKLYFSEKIFNQRVKYINDALRKFNAVGFRSPMVHRNLQWLQKLDILYDASCFDYDPFQPFPGGTGTIWPFIAGKFVELPYTIPQDHTIFYILRKKDITMWKNKIDWIIKNKGVVLVLTHPDYLIEKEHFKLYEELLMYLQSIENTWHCLPKELALWWKNKFSN